MRRNGNVALVTGGAQGIGKGIAAYLLQHDWRVVIADIDQEAGEQCVAALGHNSGLRFIAADVARELDVQRLIEEARTWGGGLDALINNAGIANAQNDPVEQLDLEDWQRKLDVNLTGPFLMTKHAVPALRDAGGAIVNIASTRALQSEPHSEAYAAAKGGLVALTHALAISLGSLIRVNCISPGWIDVRAWHANAPTQPEPLRPLDHAQHPVGRVGGPVDVAALVHYLISPESSFVTGQNFIIDGGMTRKMIYAD